MLAKLGITSPFNKRKIKESQSNKQAMPVQQQHHQQLTTTSIPMPKFNKIPVLTTNNNSSSGGGSNLPVYQSSVVNSTDSTINRPNKISSNVLNTETTSSRINKNNTNCTITQANDSNLIEQTSQMKQPAIIISTNTNTKEQRKTALPKGVAHKTQIMIPQVQTKPGVSKLQPPTLINVTSCSNENQSETKATNNNNNNTTTATTTNNNNQLKTPNIMTSNLTTGQQQNISNIQQPKVLNNQATTTKKSSLTFGLPKLTKLNSNNNNNNNNTSENSATSSPVLNQKQMNSLSASPLLTTSNSRIPSIGTPTKSQIKSPAIQIKSVLKLSNNDHQTDLKSYSYNNNNNNNNYVTFSPSKTTAITTPVTPRKLNSSSLMPPGSLIGLIKPINQSNESNTFQNDFISNNTTTKLNNPILALNKTLQQNRFKDNSQYNKQPTIQTTIKDSDSNENNNNKQINDLVIKKDVEELVDDDDDDEFDKIDLENINLVDENDEEFQKFLNSDNYESFNQNNCQQSPTNQRISTNSITTTNDLFVNLIEHNNNKTPISSPLSGTPKKHMSNMKLNMSPPQLSPPLPPHQIFDSVSQHSLPSPPPLPSVNYFATSNPSQSSNLLLKTTTTNNTNLNTFGRSNTLDRKIKIPNNNLILNLNNNNNKQPNSMEYNTNSYSNSLERRMHVNSYNQSPHRNSLSISLRSPTSSSASNKMSNYQTKLSHEPILENEHFNVTTMPQSNSSNDMMAINNAAIKCELDNARNRILTLTNQLNTNGQIVNTLEQSLSSLTFKLQKVSINLQKKDNLIIELKAYIEYLHTKYSKVFDSNDKQAFPLNSILNRQNSTESINSLNSMFSQRSCQTTTTTVTTTATNNNTNNAEPSTPKKRSNWLRSSFKKAFNRKSSTSAENSADSTNTNKQQKSDVDETDMLVKQRLANDYDEPFTNSKQNNDYSLPNSPMHIQQMYNQFKKNNNNKSQLPLNYPTSPTSHYNNSVISIGTTDELEEYQRLLRDKEIKLTDVRLEALATAHQLDQSKEENLKMRIEIEQLKADNIRMQQFLNSYQNFNSCIHTSQSSTSSTSSSQQQPINSSLSSPSPSSSISSSSHNNSKINLSLSNSTHHVDISTNSSSNCSIQLNNTNNNNNNNEEKLKNSPSNSCNNMMDNININDGKRVIVLIYLGDSDPLESDVENEEFISKQIIIGSIGISTKTNWDALDQMVKSLFKEYLDKLESDDDIPTLGLSLESIFKYYVGEMPRQANNDLIEQQQQQKLPDLLPYGYLVGSHTNIIIQLNDAYQNNSIDSLCFDTLVPKITMNRYVSLIMDHKNLLFCGPNGTSKSYLARKIGEYLAKRHNKNIETSIAYFNAENKTCKDLKQYLCTIIDQVSDKVPCVLILDNLNNIGNISEAFLDFFSSQNENKKCSYVIVTVNQSDVTSLNLHQNFKWILCANHAEPVKYYLERFLVRRLIDYEIKYQIRNIDLEKITKWIPKLWQHINKYIEVYNSADLTLGPKIFTTFPMDFRAAQNWFIELWNNHLVPFIIETVKEGIQVYGKTKNCWEDPKLWLSKTLPWLHDYNVLNRLVAIEAEMVGIIDSNALLSTLSIQKLNQEDGGGGDDDFDLKLNELDYDDEDEYPIMYKANNDSSNNNNENDKLLNMLIRLQEATLVNQQQSKRPSNEFSNHNNQASPSSSIETTLI